MAALAPEAQRGSAFGLLATIQGLGNLAASALTGLIWTVGTGSLAFLYLVVWMAAALLLLNRLRRRTAG